jgi:LPS sulfotransferase NodH
MRTYFAIVSTGRTGSTYLQHLLDSHPEIACLGEMISPLGVYAQYREMDLSQFIEERMFGDAEGVLGFKMPWPWTDEFPGVWDAFRSLGFRLISLSRRNKLDQYLSVMLADKTGLWDSSAHYPVQRIEIDPRALRGFFSTVKNVEAFLVDKCSQFDHLSVIYEDLLRGQGHAELQDFLGVTQAPLHVNTVRSRVVPRSESIANFDMLKRQFADSPWIEFFTEEEDLTQRGAPPVSLRGA